MKPYELHFDPLTELVSSIINVLLICDLYNGNIVSNKCTHRLLPINII